MPKYARNSAVFYFLAALLLFSAVPLFGSGGSDRDLARADQLIDNLQYEEAILILTDIARRDPNQFDRVQERFRKIYQIEEEFNRIANELIEVIIYEPENNEKILNLSDQLYALQHSDSLIMRNFISRTRELAQFNINRNLLREIMERGRRHLDNGDSYAALLTYSEGMSFMRDEFFTGGFGADINNEVLRETESVYSMITAYMRTSEPLSSLSVELIAALNSGDLNNIYLTTEKLIPAMNSFINLKQNLFASVNTLDRILGEIRKNDPDMGDRNHLAFVSILIRGRSTETGQEGMLGAFDTHWRHSVNAAAGVIVSLVQRSKDQSINALNAKNYADIALYQENIINYTDVYMLLLEKNRDLFTGVNPQVIALYDRNILQTDIRPFIEITAMNEANNLVLQAAQTGLRGEAVSSVISQQEENITTEAAYISGQRIRGNITALQQEINSITANGRLINAEVNSYYSVTHITDAIRAVENMNTLLTAQIRQSAAEYYSIAYNNFNSALAVRREQLERSGNYLNGISRINDDGINTVYRYPSEALAELISMTAASAVDLQNSDTVIVHYRSESSEISTAAEVSSPFTRFQSAVNDMTSVRNQGLALIETARSRAQQAETYRQEGERLFREAQLAYQRQDYDTAWDRLERASNRLSDSLEIQESVSIREMRDTQLINLGTAIAQAQNQMIIAEVRSLVDSARNSYFNGNFQLAEDSLLRARNRWRVTNPSNENDEVIYWLGIVRTALSAASGRVISPTAPLYSEMSQLLSQAQRNFEEGVRFINAGQRSLGLNKFDEARQLTMEVKLIYPVNQEAGLLDLRIEQFIDPSAFNTSFEQRLQAAVVGTRARSLEAFADLQNLAEINPRYPNIRAIITQAEIDMGFRPPPPNPANLARSRELTASASRIVDQSQTAQYDIALLQLNEAIVLDPDNTEAGRVRDRLLSRMSVPGTIVLTSEDEENYQRALRELNAGNYLTAHALVERLMQNQRNRNVQKVIELRQRIDSIL